MKKKIFKKTVVLTMLVAMGMSLFGCSKDTKKSNSDNLPTAEDLLSSVSNSEELTSGDMKTSISMDLTSYVEELNSNVDVVMATDLNVAFENDVFYVKGDIKADIYGISTTQNMNSYIVNKDGDYIIYSQDPESNEWGYVISNENASATAYMSLINVDKSLYDKFSVSSSEDKYIVNGTITLKDIVSTLGMTTEEFFSGMITDANGEYDNTEVEMTMLYDKKTKELKEYKVIIKACDFGQTKLNEMSIGLVINDVNNTKVELPEDIKKLEN